MKISALLLRFRSSPAKKTSGMTWRKALGGCQRKRGGWFYENGVGKEEGEAGDEEVEGSSEGELLLVGGPSLSPGFSLLGGFILSLGPQCVCCGSFRGLQVWKRRSELWESLLKGSSGWSPRRTAPHQWGLVLDLACVTETDSPKPPPRPTSPAPPADSCRNICLCARNEVGQPVQADPWRWRGPFVPGRLVHARRVTRRAQILVLQPIITYALTQKTQNFSFPRSSHEWTLLKNPVSSCSRGKMRFQRLSFKRLDTPQTCHDLLLIYVFLKWK